MVEILQYVNTVILIVSAIVGVKLEHRLTKLETHVDILIGRHSSNN